MSQSTDPAIAAAPSSLAAVDLPAGAGDGPRGAAVIQRHIATLPNGPGVYRMLDGKGEVLYVGKAKSLRKRLPAYVKTAALSARLQRMVALTRGLEVVTTANDVEALLLECNMIKRHRPPYNIVLRDDKSFPYIYLGKASEQTPFPRIGRHRGAKRKDSEYFGSRCAPAPTASSRTARAPACSTRSSAARRPASAASEPPTTRSCSTRRRPSSSAAATRCAKSSRPRWRRPPSTSISSRRRRSATASRRWRTSARARAST
jgi:hypothetical protein